MMISPINMSIVDMQVIKTLQGVIANKQHIEEVSKWRAEKNMEIKSGSEGICCRGL